MTQIPLTFVPPTIDITYPWEEKFSPLSLSPPINSITIAIKEHVLRIKLECLPLCFLDIEIAKACHWVFQTLFKDESSIYVVLENYIKENYQSDFDFNESDRQQRDNITTFDYKLSEMSTDLEEQEISPFIFENSENINPGQLEEKFRTFFQNEFQNFNPGMLISIKNPNGQSIIFSCEIEEQNIKKLEKIIQKQCILDFDSELLINTSMNNHLNYLNWKKDASQHDPNLNAPIYFNQSITKDLTSEGYQLYFNTIDFANSKFSKIIFECNGTSECLLLDVNDHAMKGFYDEFSIGLDKNLSFEKVCLQAMAFSKIKIPTESLNKNHPKSNRSYELAESNGYIIVRDLATIVRQNEVVSRKERLIFAACILGQYIQKNQLPDIKIYLASYQNYLVCKKNESLFFTDINLRLLYDLTNYNHYQNFCNKSYEQRIKLIDEQLILCNISNLNTYSQHKLNYLNQLLQSELDKTGNDNTSEIESLIDLGAYINTQGSRTGWSPVHTAVFFKNFFFLNSLLSRQPDVNLKSASRGLTPIFYAYSLDIINKLGAHGADFFITSKGGKTPIQWLTEPNLVKGTMPMIDKNKWLKKECKKSKEIQNQRLVAELINLGAVIPPRSAVTIAPHSALMPPLSTSMSNSPPLEPQERIAFYKQ